VRQSIKCSRARRKRLNFVERRHGEVHAVVKVCIAPPDRARISRRAGRGGRRLFGVRGHKRPYGIGAERSGEGLGHRGGAMHDLTYQIVHTEVRQQSS